MGRTTKSLAGELSRSAAARAAIKRAIHEFGIEDPHKQKRLTAFRVA